jgi:hypothetical protein
LSIKRPAFSHFFLDIFITSLYYVKVLLSGCLLVASSSEHFSGLSNSEVSKKIAHEGNYIAMENHCGMLCAGKI